MTATGDRVLLMVLAAVLSVSIERMQGEISDRTRLAVEALLRLENKDLGKNAALSNAVTRVASQLGPEPELVALITAFQLPGMESNLVQVASKHPEAPEASQALRLVFDRNGESVLRGMLHPEQPQTAPLLKALATSGDSRTLPILESVVLEGQRPIETRRLAVHSLGVTVKGASNLVAMLKLPGVAPDIRELILDELALSQWPGIRNQIGELVPGTSGAKPHLPGLSTLLALRGDAARGKAVFERPQVACNTCHQVGDEGVDFGPKLTGIGAKLGREGLIAAILDPSSGIAFGYESWRITLRDGEEWLGLIASETEEEILMRIPGGRVHSLSKHEMVTRERLSTSLMPVGLHESLSTPEFVDLIEYLLSLKATMPAPTGPP